MRDDPVDPVKLEDVQVDPQLSRDRRKMQRGVCRSPDGAVNDDRIAILYRDGSIRDISDASEILNVALLSKKIRKYYLCFQRLS